MLFYSEKPRFRSCISSPRRIFSTVLLSTYSEYLENLIYDSSNKRCTILSAFRESRAAITQETLISEDPWEIISILTFASASVLSKGRISTDIPYWDWCILREHPSGNTDHVFHLLSYQ